MKKIYIVFDGPRGVFPVTIRSGENLINYIERYTPTIAHVCESATDAHYIAAAWERGRRDIKNVSDFNSINTDLNNISGG